jgi:hypothetical protein
MIEELVVVGAGPAGLAAGVAAATADFAPLLLDTGPEIGLRRRNRATHLVTGIGGSGLYSDGKFSLWPSASYLWTLSPELLHSAFEWFREILDAVGLEVPELPSGTHIYSDRMGEELYGLDLARKRYHSMTTSLEQRINLIQNLRSTCSRVEAGVSVETMERLADGNWLLRLDGGGSLVATRVVVATGRFGPLMFHDSQQLRLRRSRVEIGVRVEQPADSFFLRDLEEPDPKLIWRPDGLDEFEWRTFCCCRNGEVIETDFDGIRSFSGRADVSPTGYSNVGFNVRPLDPTTADQAWQHVLAASRSIGPVQLPLVDILADLGDEAASLQALLGPAYAPIRQGLTLLTAEWSPSLISASVVSAPTLEGVGLYPLTNCDLSTSVENLWVAGDAVGEFRGLTAALISGFIAGQSASKWG